MRPSLKNWLDQPLISRKGRAERREVPGLVAYHFEGSTALPDPVSNISASGMYLLTATRWSLGEVIDLTLQRQGQPEEFVGNRIQMRATPVRWGADGVGLSFEHARGTQVHLWDGKAHDASEMVEPVEVVREFRVARAESFLRRICPTLGERASSALRNDVGSFRTESVIEIALRAERGLSAAEEMGRKLIHPDVLRQILDNGSWADLDWTRDLWSNLLISSCTAAGTDRGGLQFAVLLSQMNVNQSRLLDWICSESARRMAESGSSEPESVAYSADQLKMVTRIGDLVRVEREIDHLAELGLLKSRPRATYFDEEDDLVLCPTILGMEYHARSRGQRTFVPAAFSASPEIAHSSLTAGD